MACKDMHRKSMARQGCKQRGVHKGVSHFFIIIHYIPIKLKGEGERIKVSVIKVQAHSGSASICIALFETFHYEHLTLESKEGRRDSSCLNSQHSGAEAGVLEFQASLSFRVRPFL